MEKKYLIIGDYGAVELRPSVVKGDLVLRSQGRYEWLINLETEEAFYPETNTWRPLKDFPIL